MPRHERQEANKYIFGFMVDTIEISREIFGARKADLMLSINTVNELNLSFPERLEMAELLIELEECKAKSKAS